MDAYWIDRTVLTVVLVASVRDSSSNALSSRLTVFGSLPRVIFEGPIEEAIFTPG